MQTLAGNCRWLWSALLLVSVCGCGNPEDRYVPDTGDARASLEAALESWKNGGQPGLVTTLETPITFVDARWQSGKKLESFEILAEIEGEPHRTFPVRLQLTGEKAPEETRYFVLGIDPIIIYRAEDYSQPKGM